MDMWKILLPAYEWYQQELIRHQEALEQKKKQKFYGGLIFAVLILVAFLVPIDLHRKKANGQHYLMEYMAEKYPETSFSSPEEGEKKKDGNVIYTFSPSSHPDFQITAKVKYQETTKTYEITEDYSLLLLELYAGNGSSLKINLLGSSPDVDFTMLNQWFNPSTAAP